MNYFHFLGNPIIVATAKDTSVTDDSLAQPMSFGDEKAGYLTSKRLSTFKKDVV
jgi:hypothetical protein